MILHAVLLCENIVLCLLMHACTFLPDSSQPLITSITGIERSMSFRAEVIVDSGSTNAQIAFAISRQLKTAIGSLREQGISLSSREHQKSLSADNWQRALVTTIPGEKSLLRVTYFYNDIVVTSKKLYGLNSISFVMLASDYDSQLTQLKRDCSDDPSDTTDSLWYHFSPLLNSCKKRIEIEKKAIVEERGQIGFDENRIGEREASRVFLPVEATLGTPHMADRDFYPEYDKLFGFLSSRKRLIVYVFLGSDKEDARSTKDILGKQAIIFYRTIIQYFPSLKVTNTEPFALLQDVFIGENKVTNPTYQQMFN